MSDDPIDPEALGLLWAGPVCYFCEQPIRAGALAVELEIEGERVDAHRACLDDHLKDHPEDLAVDRTVH